MRSIHLVWPFVLVAWVACSDSDEPPQPTTTTSSSGGTGGDATGGAGSGGGGAGGGEGGTTPGCTAALEAALGPIDEVSDGVVDQLSSGDALELWVDASAGGFQMAATNPWIYLDLETGTRVDVTDVESFDSSDWDLALKRVQLRNNSADGGAGDGATQWLAMADFNDVTMADVDSSMLATEAWFDAMCEYETDPTGALLTTFSDWYDYDGSSMTVSPKDGVYVVRGADGTSFYKLEIVEYYANPDGSPGQTSGRYVLRVAPL